MASIKKRGAYWRVQVRRKGYPQQSQSFDTKTQAEAWARMIEGDMDWGTFVAPDESDHRVRPKCTAQRLMQGQHAVWSWFGAPFGSMAMPSEKQVMDHALAEVAGRTGDEDLMVRGDFLCGNRFVRRIAGFGKKVSF